jgi:hypothetical protein
VDDPTSPPITVQFYLSRRLLVVFIAASVGCILSIAIVMDRSLADLNPAVALRSIAAMECTVGLVYSLVNRLAMSSLYVLWSRRSPED